MKTHVKNQTNEEIQFEFGQLIRKLRLGKNLDQQTVALQAGISVGAIKNLESGAGATLKTLVAMLRVLGHVDDLLAIAPTPTLDPLTITRTANARARASRKA
jgi:transcriptional regulator with XRE-family HTH domain